MWWATLPFKISDHREDYGQIILSAFQGFVRSAQSPKSITVQTNVYEDICICSRACLLFFLNLFQDYSYTVIGDRLYSIVSWQAYIFPSPFTCIHPGDPFLRALNQISRDIGPKRTEKCVFKCSWLIVDAVFEIMERMEKASHCSTVCQWGQGWWFLMWLCFFFSFEIENCWKKLPCFWKK